jgi:putative ABC transport system ATP-binding protein
MSNIIELNKINFWYDRGRVSETKALNDINFFVEEGEYVAFFGPSGSGKTTLLYLIAGIENNQEGKAMVGGRDISTFTQEELAIYRQTQVGIIFQQFNLIPTLDVLRNVMLPMAFRGLSRAEQRKRALHVLERLDLVQYSKRYPLELSGGQQQRVGIARALANDPPIIIADEPLGNLDSENANLVLAFLKELNEKDKRTIIMVTHEAWSLKDVGRIFFIKDGGLVKTEKVDRRTVAKSLSEQIFGKMDLSPSGRQVLAHSLSNLFLRGYSVDESMRFEEILAKRLKEELSAIEFKDLLGRSFLSGGVGLWKQKTERISKIVDDILKRRKEVSVIHADLEKNPEAPISAEANRLCRWLLEDYKGRLGDIQRYKLEKMIEERLKNAVTPEFFKEALFTPRSKSGVGLSFRAAQRFGERLETALS